MEDSLAKICELWTSPREIPETAIFFCLVVGVIMDVNNTIVIWLSWDTSTYSQIEVGAFSIPPKKKTARTVSRKVVAIIQRLQFFHWGMSYFFEGFQDYNGRVVEPNLELTSFTLTSGPVCIDCLTLGICEGSHQAVFSKPNPNMVTSPSWSLYTSLPIYKTKTKKKTSFVSKQHELQNHGPAICSSHFCWSNPQELKKWPVHPHLFGPLCAIKCSCATWKKAPKIFGWKRLRYHSTYIYTLHFGFLWKKNIPFCRWYDEVHDDSRICHFEMLFPACPSRKKLSTPNTPLSPF